MSCDFVGYRLRSLAKRMRAKPAVDAPFLFPLMELPHELIALVVQCVADENENHNKGLINLSSTCRLLQSLAEEHIYCYHVLRDAKDTGKFARALARQKNRLPHVRDLELFCDGFVSSYCFRVLRSFEQILTTCTLTQSLTAKLSHDVGDSHRSQATAPPSV